ncbi:amino acid ABC transporter permease [Candidatus Bipolaricaulota bacterium]|nr:amino acid ABC transporter permease [Candidatus Bipolaricaulota bacterium]
MGFFQFVGDILPQLLQATVTTLQLTAASIVLGFVVGILLSLGRIYAPKPIRWLTGAYIQFFRGTPLLAQLLLVYYGLPPYLGMIGIRISPLFAAIIGLGLNSAAYQAEYFRGAVQSIESGQMMAARSMGMSKLVAIRNVILPQALRIVIPSWSNELIYSIKYSSLAYFVSLTELTFVGKKIALHTARTFETYVIVAMIYLVIVLIVSKLLLMLENHVRVPGLGATRYAHRRG